MVLWVDKKVFLQSSSWACREHGNHKERQREPDSRRIAFIWESRKCSSLNLKEKVRKGEQMRMGLINTWPFWWVASGGATDKLQTIFLLFYPLAHSCKWQFLICTYLWLTLLRSQRSTQIINLAKLCRKIMTSPPAPNLPKVQLCSVIGREARQLMQSRRTPCRSWNRIGNVISLNNSDIWNVIQIYKQISNWPRRRKRDRPCDWKIGHLILMQPFCC